MISDGAASVDRPDRGPADAAFLMCGPRRDIHRAVEECARAGTVLLVDADPQGSALDWQEQRAADGAFPVIGLAKTRLHREIPVIGRHYDWVVIDGPPRANDLAKSAIAASDIVLIPVQPSPFDVWAAQDILTLVEECAVLKPVDARFVVNRLFLGTRLAAEVRDAYSSRPFRSPCSPRPFATARNMPRRCASARRRSTRNRPGQRPVTL